MIQEPNTSCLDSHRLCLWRTFACNSYSCESNYIVSRFYKITATTTTARTRRRTTAIKTDVTTRQCDDDNHYQNKRHTKNYSKHFTHLHECNACKPSHNFVSWHQVTNIAQQRKRTNKAVEVNNPEKQTQHKHNHNQSYAHTQRRPQTKAHIDSARTTQIFRTGPSIQSSINSWSPKVDIHRSKPSCQY